MTAFDTCDTELNFKPYHYDPLYKGDGIVGAFNGHDAPSLIRFVYDGEHLMKGLAAVGPVLFAGFTGLAWLVIVTLLIIRRCPIRCIRYAHHTIDTEVDSPEKTDYDDAPSAFRRSVYSALTCGLSSEHGFFNAVVLITPVVGLFVIVASGVFATYAIGPGHNFPHVVLAFETGDHYIQNVANDVSDVYDILHAYNKTTRDLHDAVANVSLTTQQRANYNAWRASSLSTIDAMNNTFLVVEDELHQLNMTRTVDTLQRFYDQYWTPFELTTMSYYIVFVVTLLIALVMPICYHRNMNLRLPQHRCIVNMAIVTESAVLVLIPIGIAFGTLSIAMAQSTAVTCDQPAAELHTFWEEEFKPNAYLEYYLHCGVNETAYHCDAPFQLEWKRRVGSERRKLTSALLWPDNFTWSSDDMQPIIVSLHIHSSTLLDAVLSLDESLNCFKVREHVSSIAENICENGLVLFPAVSIMLLILIPGSLAALFALSITPFRPVRQETTFTGKATPKLPKRAPSMPTQKKGSSTFFSSSSPSHKRSLRSMNYLI